MNIVLIGYRGTGKSSIGRMLAGNLGRSFADADVLITERAQKTIKQIFEDHGEGHFRDLESQVIADLAGRDEHIIALGGGAVLRPQNIAALQPNSTIIWLTAAPEILYARIQADTATNATRPNLTSTGGLREIQALLAARLPLYQAAAHHTLPVDTLTIEQAAEKIADLLAMPRR